MTNKALADAEGKLTMLLLELRGTANHERAKLYVAKMTGGRTLAEYLHAEAVPIKERAALATTLIEILLTQDYSRLPELPAMENGNRVLPAPSVRNGHRPASGRGVEPTAEIQDDDSDEADDDEADELPLSRAEIERMVRAQVRAELAGVFELVAKVLKETK